MTSIPRLSAMAIIPELSTSAAAAAAAPRGKYNWDRTEMQRVFDLFDENKDGRISAQELQQYMRKVGVVLSDQKVTEMVRSVDKNNDDVVDFEEFYELYTTLLDEGAENYTPRTRSAKVDNEHEEALRRAFSVFDENNDGLISADELQKVLLQLGLPEGRSLLGCQRMIAKVDVDGDGKVNFREFKAMMRASALLN